MILCASILLNKSLMEEATKLTLVAGYDTEIVYRREDGHPSRY